MILGVLVKNLEATEKKRMAHQYIGKDDDDDDDDDEIKKKLAPRIKERE
jgi:hypothetical protein